MTRGLPILALVAVLFILSGYLLQGYFKSYSEMPQYQRWVEKHLDNTDQEISTFILDTTVISKIYDPQERVLRSDLAQVYRLRDKSYTLCFYQEDSLLFWSNTNMVPESYWVRNMVSSDTMMKFDNGYFRVKKYPIDDPKGEKFALAYTPIKYEYANVEGAFEDYFPASKKIPGNLKVSSFKTKYPIKVDKGVHLAYLQAFNVEIFGGKTYVFILFSLALILLALLTHRIAGVIAEREGVLKGVIFLFFSVIGIRILAYALDMTGFFNHFFSYDGVESTNKIRSDLGDTLINILLLFWLLLFTFRQLRVLSFDHISSKGKIFLASVNYFSILLCMLMISGICKSLILESGIEFDFNNVFNINRVGFFALIGIILFLLIFFIVSHRMTLTIQRLDLRQPARFLSIGLSFVLIYPAFLNIDPDYPIYIFYLAGIVYLLLFDLFIESPKPNAAWMVIWLVIFAGFSSVLLFKYSKDGDLLKRAHIARQLIQEVDPVLFNKTNDILKEIGQQHELQGNLASCSSIYEVEDAIEKFTSRKISQNHYISAFYVPTVEVHLQESTSGDSTIGSTIPQGPHEYWQDSLYYVTLSDQMHHYYLFNTNGIMHNNRQYRIGVTCRRKKISNQPEFHSLLHSAYFKDISGLDTYSYAIYRKDSLIESSGHVYERILPSELHNKTERTQELVSGDRSELSHPYNQYTILIGRDLLGLLKPLSLFSYLFALLIIMVGLLGLIHTFYPILPLNFSFKISRNYTLRNKIQIAVLALIVVSFIFVGLVTIIYFNNSSNQYDKERLINKAISVQYDAENKLQVLRNTTFSSDLVHEIVQSLSKIHRTDIHLFNRFGRLIYSSDMDIFNNRLVAPYMNPVAMRELIDLGGQIYINDEEKIGELTYKAAFIPILEENQRPLGFISLPYSSASIREQGNIKDFMGTLLNVYVLLLLIAGIIAILVANSITRPISVLGEKIKAFKLGTRNEPIKWDNNDELGALINEYNFLIDKMEKSAELLAQNEREVAWREMAKQVAHEIKNPLTPMKLSIQYLEHKIATLPRNEVETLVKRVASTLIEQIDNLNKIASEFSNFSKLPKPNNEPLILNDLISSVHDLFRKREDIIFNLYVPIDEIYVFADKSHLLRILNNLIKNAIQAIPAIRKGKIDIKLYTKNGKAIIQVSDNGSGIPRDMQDKVFYPNFTTKSSGTGLGLAICKDMAIAYKGKIYFKTVENIGTDFYFELPLMENPTETQSRP